MYLDTMSWRYACPALLLSVEEEVWRSSYGLELEDTELLEAVGRPYVLLLLLLLLLFDWWLLADDEFGTGGNQA